MDYIELILVAVEIMNFFEILFYFSNLKIKLLDKFILKFSFGGRSTSSYVI